MNAVNDAIVVHLSIMMMMLQNDDSITTILHNKHHLYPRNHANCTDSSQDTADKQCIITIRWSNSSS